MKSDSYTPQPIDTSDIVLDKELYSLAEVLAKNVHEVWAMNRIKEGWTLGDTRDDKIKKHPCLVQYEQLPEHEKDYDRNTAMSTLKLLIKLGYKITK